MLPILAKQKINKYNCIILINQLSDNFYAVCPKSAAKVKMFRRTRCIFWTKHNRWRWWIQLIPSRTQSSVSEVTGRWIFTFFCQFPVFVLSEANWLLTVAMSLETLRKFHVWTKILTWKLTWCQMWTGLISHKNTHFYNLTIYSKLIFFTRRKPETRWNLFLHMWVPHFLSFSHVN